MKLKVISALIGATMFVLFEGFASAQEVQRVVVTSYGETVDTATKNAATAALEQVVGTFVDASTILKKKKEISAGLVKQTKSITREINNYSNGAIEKLSVVDAQQQGNLYKVTVDAVVRISELKVLMAGITGKAKVDSRGLLAQVQAQQEQEKNLVSILEDNLLNPQFDGRAYDIKVGEAYLIENAPNAKERKIYRNIKNEDGISTVVIPVVVDLRAEYLNKLKSVLEEIEQDPLQDLRETSGHRNLEKTDSLYDDALETAVQSGRLKGVLISLPTNQDIVQTGNKYRRFYIKNAEDLDFKAIKSALFVSLKNENGDSILEERFSKGGPSFSSRLYLGAESRRSGNRIEMYELDSVSSADFSSVNISISQII